MGQVVLFYGELYLDENGEGILSPLRIVIIAILFYIGYRLIVGGKGKKSPEPQPEKDGSSKEMPINDVLVEDPVCHKLIPKQQAVTHRHGDQTIYFCSEKCCTKFKSLQGESK